MVLPSRIIFEGRTHSTEIMLKNEGNTPGTYRIFLKEMDMSPDGSLEERDKAAGEITAADLVRFSPHQVDLGPGEAQTVRVQLSSPEALPDGEYRSHMVFEGIPPAEKPEPEDANAPQSVSLVLRPIFGISIPLIIRHGETLGRISLADLKLEAPQPAEAAQAAQYLQAPAASQAPEDEDFPTLCLRLVREGNRSLLGDLQVSVVSGTTQKPGTVVGLKRGVAVYATLAARNVKIELDGHPADYKGGRLKVTYTPKDFEGKVETALLDVP
jgi:hypothetical protein